MRIFANLEFDREQRERLTAGTVGDDVYFGDPERFTDQDKQALVSSEVAFGWCPPEWLVVAAQLRWFQLDSVGYEQYSSLDWEALARTLTVTDVLHTGARRKWLHHPAHMRNSSAMRRNFPVESEKKLRRSCREARALGL